MNLEPGDLVRYPKFWDKRDPNLFHLGTLISINGTEAIISVPGFTQRIIVKLNSLTLHAKQNSSPANNP